MARGAIFGSGSRPPDKERPGHTDPEKREEGRSPIFFLPFGPQFGLKLRRALPLDPPLILKILFFAELKLQV